ncbi:MAG: ionic transporter y4hA [Thermoleophilia bacterium]|jgi:Ca2+:H+ antiporter|nr:ionic transporter y4hA [Thermoleophilia bacterium]
MSALNSERWLPATVTALPVVSIVALAAAWGRSLPAAVEVLLIALLIGAVMTAVHHAEVVAHRVGEPFGSLILAVAVTVIEVGLIVSLMISGGEGVSTLARDTVFAAVMITCNGIVGISLLVGALRTRVTVYNAAGASAALMTVLTLATLSLVVPKFTTSTPGDDFSPQQLAFAAVTALALYALFVFVQSVRHRSYFLPPNVGNAAMVDEDDNGESAPRPSSRTTWRSVVLLLVALVGVVGLAKVESSTIEGQVEALGLPHAVVGVVIALLVLSPETIAAYRNARRGRMQTSLNLAYGSAVASIGLTVPTIAVASIWLDGPLHLGLGDVQIVLLVLTALVSILTVLPGRATVLQAGVHLTLCASFLFLAAFP